MPIVPVTSIEEYKRIKETLREEYERNRTGDQDIFRQQTKVLQPLIDTTKTTQQESLSTLKALQESQNVTNRELQRTQDILEQQALPALQQRQALAAPEVQDSFMTPDATLQVDLDGQLNETDKENLQDLSFELPSLVFKNKNIEEALEKIKKENRRIGQYLGEKSKLSEKEKDIHISRRKTLETYRDIIKGLEGAKQFVSTPKRGKGLTGRIDAIYYSSVDDLCQKLSELVAAKSAGHTGLNNQINTILDELLKIKAIDKDEYNALYKSIFA
ncbi:MAG TPA: hypothetical protein VKR58_12335 [Aquella sp.]|nr:hypothetical protein [Aquella sp.]